MRILQMVENLLADVRYALRGFQSSPGFTATVVVMLALGIGANTAIFSIVDRLFLRALPYPESNQLLMIYETSPATSRSAVSPANWLDWQRLSHSFETLAAWNFASATFAGEGDPELLSGQAASAEFFPTLKVSPLLGRLFTPDDDRPNAAPVIILSHRLWQRRFGADPNIIGKKLELDARPVEVIGVMPQGFYFMNPLAEFWVPYAIDRQRDWRATSGRSIPSILGRLKLGVSTAPAQAEMQTIGAQLEQAYVFNKRTSVNIVPLREALTGEVRTSLLVLLAAVSVLLLVACFNVASMMLARSSSRRREIAVRTSLGASRGAIVRQLLVESLLLGGVGGAVGFLVALWGVSALVELTPRNLIRVVEVPLDRWVLLYTSGISLLTGLTFGLVPVITATRGFLAGHLHGAGRSITHSARLRQGLVVAQVMMTVILLCGAGLLVRSFAALNSFSTGVDPNQVLTMQITMPAPRYDGNQQVEFVTRILERLEKLPGVQSAGATRSLPVIGPTAGTGVHFKGTPDVPMNDRPMARIRMATPGYFKTVGTTIVHGREFTWDDQQPNAELVFVVNEAFVKAHLPGKDPLETSMSVAWMNLENSFGRIVGVATDVREGSLRGGVQPTVFYNQRQLSYNGMTLFIRTNRPATIAREAVQVIHDIDRNVPVTQVRTLREAFGQSLAQDRLNAVVSGAFAVTALLLASFGLYGLLAFIVAERTREIGIRMALGAEAATLVQMVMNHGLSLVAAGGLLGLIGAFAISRFIKTLLFEVSSYDPTTFVAVTLLLIFVGALAAFLPAYRAATVNPIVALRQE
jgi:putative ABC transport system permease protein